jgi:uncharacterized membrane protein HdeD (DUF308 family)
LKKVSPFLFRIFILSALILVAGYGLFFLFPQIQIFIFPFIIVFFFVLTSLLHLWVSKGSEEHPRRFPAYFMGATTIKLLASLAFIVIYALKQPAEAKRFIVIFFAVYMIYTAFETISLLKNLKGRQ